MGYIIERDKEILVAGHRGIRAKYPENTMISFRKALEAGVDMLEFDINITKDKQLVIMHDNTVDRTTNGTGYIHDMNLEQIKELDAGSWFSGEFTNEKVPTLEEFLRWVSKYNDLLFNVEIKEETFETVDLTIDMLKAFDVLDRCVITCFNASIVKYAFHTYNIKTQGFPDEMTRNFEDGEKGTRSLLYSVGIPIHLISKKYVDSYKNAGIKPWAWPINDEKQTMQCIDAGVLLVTSDNPETVLNTLREKGYHK